MIYWIIKNKKTGKIWKDIFNSKSEADRELKNQISYMPQGLTSSNWFIEENEAYRLKAKVDNDFKDFEK